MCTGKYGLKYCSFLFYLLFFSVTIPAKSQTLKSGEQVYKETCSVCHATGVSNAPKFGDKKLWAPLIKEDQDGLTADAWGGVRAMPPKGGNPALSLEEFSRAVAYMARASGANWKDPDSAMLSKIRAAEKKNQEKAGKKK